MLSLFEFSRRIDCIENVISKSDFFLEDNDFLILLNELKKESVISAWKNRTNLLLKLYISFEKESLSSTDPLFNEIGEQIIHIFEDEFDLYHSKELFFDIISSLKNKDFYESFYLTNANDYYDLAYDILLFSKENPLNIIFNINQYGFIRTNLKLKKNSSTQSDILIIQSIESDCFFSKIEISLNKLGLCEENISIFKIENEIEQKVSFRNKVQLLKKYFPHVIVDIMFQLECNKGFWGVKRFFIYRGFLQLFVDFLKKNKNT